MVALQSSAITFSYQDLSLHGAFSGLKTVPANAFDQAEHRVDLRGLQGAEMRKWQGGSSVVGGRWPVPQLLRGIAASLVALSLLLAGPGRRTSVAEEGTAVRVVPSSPQAEVGETVAVDIQVEEVTDLYGVELFLSFDPDLAEVQDADPEQEGVQVQAGSFLSADFVVQNSADNASGTVVYAVTQTAPRAPAEGSGVLATITFKGFKAGTSPIAFAHVELASYPDGAQIPASVQDGEITIVLPPTATSPPTRTPTLPPPTPTAAPTSTPAPVPPTSTATPTRTTTPIPPTGTVTPVATPSPTSTSAPATSTASPSPTPSAKAVVEEPTVTSTPTSPPAEGLTRAIPSPTPLPMATPGERPPSQPTPTKQSPSQPTKSRRYLLLSLALILAAGGAAAGFWVLTRRD